jgi:hypothetical protein
MGRVSVRGLTVLVLLAAFPCFPRISLAQSPDEPLACVEGDQCFYDLPIYDPIDLARKKAGQEKIERERSERWQALVRSKEQQRQNQLQEQRASASGIPPNCKWPDRFQACMQGNGACIPQGYPGGVTSEGELRQCCIRAGCIMGAPNP